MMDCSSRLPSCYRSTRYYPLTQKYYALNASFERYQFMEKVERNVELARITPPAHPPPFRQQPPGSLYCQVCRQSYENYQEHINSSQHI